MKPLPNRKQNVKRPQRDSLGRVSHRLRMFLCETYFYIPSTSIASCIHLGQSKT